MTDLHDVRLDKWQESSEPDPPRTGRLIAVVAVILLAAGGGGYFWWTHRSQARPPEVRTLTEQAVAPAAPAAPVAEPGDNIPLPALEQTDPLVRELVSKLSANPKVAAWLTTDQLLRNFTVSIFTIANGKSPSKHLSKVRPTEKFQVIEDRGTTIIDPRSYRRYDAYADAVGALDARGTARLYATLKPRIEEAYRELGEGNAPFDRTFERAIQELLKTPVVDGNIALSSKTVSYEFADPRLQALPAVQRQFLRMGPRNIRIIQAKLREIAPLAGLSTDVH